MNSIFTNVSAGNSLLMLDYDGTLAPFNVNRLEAKPYPGILERLHKLISLKRTHVTIISGRSLNEVENLLENPSQLEIWGSHGFERKHLDGKKSGITLDPDTKSRINQGIMKTSACEIKPYAVAIHWRGLSENEKNELQLKTENHWKPLLNENLEIHYFDGGMELRSRKVNKGTIVKQILKEFPDIKAIAYLGDDETDEEAFKALGSRGLKVLVKKDYRPTIADIHIVPPQELFVFLDKWILAAEDKE